MGFLPQTDIPFYQNKNFGDNQHEHKEKMEKMEEYAKKGCQTGYLII